MTIYHKVRRMFTSNYTFMLNIKASIAGYNKEGEDGC